MNSFSLSLDTKLYFGDHITGETLLRHRELLQGNIMIVTTGRSLIRHGHLDRVKGFLKSAVPDCGILVCDHISNNPDIREVRECVQTGQKNEVGCVIGFGGGSAMDAAKLVAACIGEKEDAGTFFLSEKAPEKRHTKLIAIPTTAGTGSELSCAAIISDRDQKRKTGVRGRGMAPDLAITDPVFTWSVGEKTTMETGFDALTHAIESYIAVKSNPFSQMLSENTIRKGGAALRILKKDPEHHDARRDMAFASMCMGLNLKDVGTGLPHRLQYPIGAVTESSHPAGLAALYPSWLSHEYEVNAEKVGNITEWLFLKRCTSAEEIREAMADFLEELGILYTLPSIGCVNYTPESLAEMVSGNTANDPLSEKEGIIETIYRESM